MHCSLCIPEIVSLIFYETLNGAEQSLNHLNRDSAQTLAGLARTCKAFRDPALDLLWKSQCTVMNVLNCMRGDIWKLLDDTDTEDVVTVEKACTSNDWERPLIYSHRVRHFKYQLSYSYPDCAAFYEMLRMCLPPEPLFPNIESLLWETSDAALRLLICLSFPPSLRNALCFRPVLDFVHLDDQTPLSPVLGLPSKTEVPSSCDIDVLTLTVTDARAATEVLARLHASPIRSLTIQFPKNTSATAVREIYNGVAVNCNHASLVSLSIALPPRDSTDTAADPEQISLYAVPGTHFFPLFTLTTLTSVTLATPVGLDLDDAAAAEIARAWPRITSLDLAGSAFLHVPPRMTLCALLAFAWFCPHLWRLSLPINARSVPKWQKAQTAAEARPTQRRLRSLHVGDSPVGTPLDVAAYLSSIFPRLEWVSAGKEDPRDEPVRAEVLAGRRKWKAVEAALPVLRKVRVEENPPTGISDHILNPHAKELLPGNAALAQRIKSVDLNYLVRLAAEKQHPNDTPSAAASKPPGSPPGNLSYRVKRRFNGDLPPLTNLSKELGLNHPIKDRALRILTKDHARRQVPYPNV
ncbi:hypothetical protein B0H14DRAFT_3853206 [Mycena olivaceomarginata]|nr:hypothetical protein B0H14DRAFT_3853206 [Mycena olivaceomarginata]